MLDVYAPDASSSMGPPLAMQSRDSQPGSTIGLDDDVSIAAGDLILRNMCPPGNDGLKSHVLATQDGDLKKPLDVKVPIFQTLLVKQLIDGKGDYKDEVMIVGTLIQRTLGVDLTQWRSDVGDEDHDMAGFFQYRVNERAKQDGQFEVRKSVKSTMLGVNGNQTSLCQRSTTMSVCLPTIRHTVLDADPFCIIAIECSLELETTVRKLPPGQDLQTGYETEDRDQTAEAMLRPDMWAHLEDPRNLVAVKNWQGLEFDRCRPYDPINTSPTVEFTVEKMKDNQMCYVPKLTVTWYLEKQALATFFETLLPIIFCNLASTLMFFLNSHAADDPDFKYSFNNIMDANLTLGLTIIFLIPSLVQKNSFMTTSFGRDDCFVLMLIAQGYLLGWTASTDEEIQFRYWNGEEEKEYFVLERFIMVNDDAKLGQGSFENGPKILEVQEVPLCECQLCTNYYFPHFRSE